MPCRGNPSVPFRGTGPVAISSLPTPSDPGEREPHAISLSRDCWLIQSRWGSRHRAFFPTASRVKFPVRRSTSLSVDTQHD